MSRAAETLPGLLAATALCASACADSGPPAAPSPPLGPAWGVSGHVVDIVSKTAAPSAQITFTALALPQSYTASADSGGAYQMAVQNVGLYRVNVTGSRFPQIVYVPAARSYTTDLLVGSSDCPVMYGRVFDSHTSKVVPGARILFVDTSSTAGADGSYRVSLGCRSGGYGSGTLGITATHPDYVAQGFLGTRREFITNDYQQRMDFALVPN